MAPASSCSATGTPPRHHGPRRLGQRRLPATRHPSSLQENNYKSVGAIKVTGASPDLGLRRLFLPTAVITDEQGPSSIFPDAQEAGSWR